MKSLASNGGRHLSIREFWGDWNTSFAQAPTLGRGDREGTV